MQDYGETSPALKRKEKTGLKLGLGSCGKTKVFVTLLLRYFLFSNKCFENLFVQSHKNCYFSEKKIQKLLDGDMKTLLSPNNNSFFSKDLSLQVQYLFSL